MSFFTALAIMGTAFSVQASAKAAKAQEQATQVQIKQEQAKVSRERRGLLRRGLIARARAANVAATTGMAETSAFLGGSGALSSQVGSNLGYGGMMSGLSQDITRLSGKAAQAQGQAQMWGQIGSLGMQLGGAEDIIQGVKKWNIQRKMPNYGPPSVQ
jgi:hypothetical protein